MLSITFTVNDHDKDGDVVEQGIFLNFGDKEDYSIFRFKVGRTLASIDLLVEQLLIIKEEIKENYPNVL